MGFHQSHSPHQIASVCFILCFSIALLFLRQLSSSDPSSIFFDPETAFVPRYSNIRRLQAENFLVESAAGSRQNFTVQSAPRLAVGIPTVQRAERYFRVAVGSLLDGLLIEERQNIDLTFLLADLDPNRHYAYNEPWFHDLPDHVLTYEDASPAEKERLANWEAFDVEYRTKPLHDYIRLLLHCWRTGAEYILLLEDDVLAAEGWFSRTMSALDKIHAEHPGADFLYLRLFFTSSLLGWNSEEWLRYLLWSFAGWPLVGLGLFIARSCHTASAAFLTRNTVRVILLVCVPAVIGLYFAGGRLTMAPLASGPQLMNNYGCCSQALVFPREQVPDLVEYYRRAGTGFVDMLTEDYAEEQGLQRWALVPSVFQHSGAKSTKGDNYGRSSNWNRNVAENIWNFGFEALGAER